MLPDSVQKFKSETAVYTDRGTTYRITVRYGMHHIRGNRQPYFSITADIDRKAMGDRWVEDSGGCLHEDIARRFPRLAPLIRWHLCDQDGTPMHYVANGVYHAKLHRGGSDPYGTGAHGHPPYVNANPKAREHFASTIVWGSLPGETDAALDELLAQRDPTEALRARLPELQAAFNRTMDEFDVERIDMPPTD
jgi:hypothetical protein